MNTTALKDDFLAVYQSLKFSKSDKDELETADIERRCLATKYFTAKECESEELGACVLRNGLKEYQTIMENKNGVNNYWKQIKAQNPKTINDPRQWTSALHDISVALQFLKPLPCTSDNTLPCQAKVISDKQVESLVKIWKNTDSSTRIRKVSGQKKTTQDQISSLRSSDLMECDDFDSELIGATVSHSLSTPAYGNRSGQEGLFNKQYSKSFPATNESVTLPRQQSLRVDNHIPLRNGKEKPAIVSRNYNDRQNVSKGPSRTVSSSHNNENDSTDKLSFFKTAKQELDLQQAKSNKPQQKKTLGGKGAVNAQFVCPFKREKEKSEQASNNAYDGESNLTETDNELLKNIEPKMVELIKNEIMDSKTTITWDDIAGLEYAKKIIKEVVVYPMLRPDIFTGLRRPPKGILLFGPPGTGKTLIGKCIASQSKATFFSISASSLTSKWIGEGEKMVRALFAVARVYQPSVVFVDEIDSLLTHRSETEHESSRRLKTEFLVQLDGAGTGDDDRILIVGATNRPQELDEAARRRLVKRLYVPLPELQARKQIINNLLVTIPHDLTEDDILQVAQKSKGYSGADMTNLCKEASMGPIRSIPFSQLEDIRTEDVRHVTINDFREALNHVRPSVSESSLSAYVEWDSMYGAGTAQNNAI